MKLVITDSGLGGLSVCANLAANLSNKMLGENYEIQYINAVPEKDYGYNRMSDRTEKIKVFDQFLSTVSHKYRPDYIFIACNSLSVLLKETTLYRSKNIPVLGIVDTGVELLMAHYRPKTTNIIILAAPTTIAENTYHEKLIAEGIPANRIISQPCPELANTISNDSAGSMIGNLVSRYLSNALDKSTATCDRYLIYLGCTHYGYRQDIFKQEMDKYQRPYEIINPNDAVTIDLFPAKNISHSTSKPGQVNIKFITSYPIPKREMVNLSNYLKNISSATVNALKNYILDRDLF